MNSKQITLVYFSPTNTTQTIMEEIARGIGKKISAVIDITKSENRMKPSYDLGDGPVLIGAPVYSGRLPKDFVNSLKMIRASGNPAILTVLYGNREFEDALLELKNIAIDCGFFPLAASAFIGEHSFSNKKLPIAQNRPDGADLEKAFSFGAQVAGLLNNSDKWDGTDRLIVPGNFPYKDGWALTIPFIGVTKECDDCGVCVTVCPKEAIDENDTYSTIEENCIFCCACIKACPRDARILKDGPIKEKTKWLNENCAKRKEPEIFLPVL